MTFFIQHCPYCGRRFRVHVSALGHEIECHHCLTVFCAFDEPVDESEASDRIEQWAREHSTRAGSPTSDSTAPTFRPR